MATVESVMASHAGPAIASAQAGQVTVQRGSYELSAAESGDNTLVIRVVRLPAQHRLVSLVVEHDALDAGAGLLLDFGIEDTIQDPVDTSDSTLIATAATIGQAAGTTRYETQAMLEFGVTNYDRFVTAEVDTAAATNAGGTLAFNLVTRPELGSQFDGNA